MAKTSLPLFAAVSLLAGPAGLHAQDNGIGAPELQDFSLPGTRTTPAAPVVPIAPPPPPTSTQPPAEQPRAPAPARQAPARTAPDPAPAPPPAESPAAPVDEPAPAPPANEAQPAAPVEAAPPPVPAPTPAPAGQDWTLWAAAGGAGLLLLAGLVLLLRRRRRGEGAEPEPAIAVAPPPLPPPPPPRLRPLVEIDFRPERLVTSDAQAVIHFELVIRNRGDAPATDLRIEARLFNASGAEARDVETFFAATPDANTTGMVLPAGRGAQFTSAVAIPRDQMRVVEMGGRPLFIPTVAIRVVHHDADGEAVRIVRRYLVGIEPREPTGKMGPFRMDIGPRIYRQIGQRPIVA